MNQASLTGTISGLCSGEPRGTHPASAVRPSTETESGPQVTGNSSSYPTLTRTHNNHTTQHTHTHPHPTHQHPHTHPHIHTHTHTHTHAHTHGHTQSSLPQFLLILPGVLSICGQIGALCIFAHGCEEGLLIYIYNIYIGIFLH